MKKHENKTVSAILSITIICCAFIGIPITANAANSQFDVSGEVYSFDEDTAYTFSTASPDGREIDHGRLSVSGVSVKKEDHNGFIGFSVDKAYTEEVDYNLTFTYTFSSAYINAADENWHLIEESGKKVDMISLGEKIKDGAVILQTSKDGKVWVTTETLTNAFADSNQFTYTTTDVQLVNGCYYRVIIAYELSRKVDPSKILFVSVDNYETKRCVEVYIFYASEKNARNVISNSEMYDLGQAERTEKFDGYFGTQEMIRGKDPHYGWKLGQFRVGGYTEVRTDSSGNIVVLKNVGDQVVLWFDLFYGLDSLNNNPALSIESDPAGHDQFFQTPTQDFGRGALIIRKTDYNNHTGVPVVYKNYLEAVATVGANTMVDLFEEGDYEIALDYAVRNDKTVVFGNSIFPGESHYRIYFKFSVRNANSMFYPRDVKTQSELSNGDITPNGFFLDLANSKYLQLNIVREVLKDGATGLTEDIRLNTVAKDGSTYTKDGVYTITVTNQYTGRSTTKTIYVGDNNILKAYMITGLSISEIQNRIAEGATIADDGTLIDPPTIPEIAPEYEASEISEDTISGQPETIATQPTEYVPATEQFAEEDILPETEGQNSGLPIPPIFFAGIAIVIVTAIGFAVNQRKRKERME